MPFFRHPASQNQPAFMVQNPDQLPRQPMAPFDFSYGFHPPQFQAHPGQRIMYRMPQQGPRNPGPRAPMMHGPGPNAQIVPNDGRMPPHAQVGQPERDLAHADWTSALRQGQPGTHGAHHPEKVKPSDVTKPEFVPLQVNRTMKSGKKPKTVAVDQTAQVNTRSLFLHCCFFKSFYFKWNYFLAKIGNKDAVLLFTH